MREWKITYLGEKVRPVITSSMATAETVADITTRYDAIFTAKTKYLSHLQFIKTKRELEKEQKFKESSLSIPLPKFKGYGAFDKRITQADDARYAEEQLSRWDSLTSGERDRRYR